MRRRELIVSAGTALLAWPRVARAQAQAKMSHLGYLGFGTPAASATRVEALRAGLRDLGYVEGKNLVIEFRWAGAADKMTEAAADLVRMNVDIIFATSSTESEAARRATSTIPIVFATHADPEGVGHVSSLARPGGNTDLVERKVDVIVADTTPATRAAQRATSTIPIVMAIVADPVGDGLVASLSQPGGNVTGLSIMLAELQRQTAATAQGDDAKPHPGVALGNPPTPYHAKQSRTSRR